MDRKNPETVSAETNDEDPLESVGVFFFFFEATGTFSGMTGT